MELGYTIERMTEADLDEVLEIERRSFAQPWSARAFRSEISLPYALYLVARPAKGAPPTRTIRLWPPRKGRETTPRPPVVGYAGVQWILDEGHITTLAVHPAYRRRGIGALLLLNLAERARERGVTRLTLEVRVSNQAAQRLYEAFGFRVEGRRLRYYADGEDAWIMWSERLDAPESLARLERLRQKFESRWHAEGTLSGGKARDAYPGTGNLV